MTNNEAQHNHVNIEKPEGKKKKGRKEWKTTLTIRARSDLTGEFDWARRIMELSV